MYNTAIFSVFINNEFLKVDVYAYMKTTLIIKIIHLGVFIPFLSFVVFCCCFTYNARIFGKVQYYKKDGSIAYYL